MPKHSKKLSQKEKDEVIAAFQKDFDLAFTAESRNRVQMVEDLEFAALDQWPDEVKRERGDRPMLTLDKIGKDVRKVLGGIRQNMPSIKVDPIDDTSDPETAEVLEDLIRQIEQHSDARRAYLTAANFQVKCGYGVWRVNTVSNQDDIFEQDVCIMPVKNPFTVYFDPDAIMPQKQDGRFVIVSATMDGERFKEKYDIDIPTSIPNQGVGETQERWYSSDSVRIGEYFRKVREKRTLLQLSNGQVVLADDVTEQDIELYRAQGVTPVREREAETDVIKWYKLTCFEVIDHKEWPSKYFPLIPVYGEEDNIEGETSYRGIVRAAKDPQRMYNYWNSAAAEAIALQPKAPWLVTAEQIKNYKRFWERANNENLPYLPYEPDAKAPPPSRIDPPAMQAGLLQQAGISANDVSEATGVVDSNAAELTDQRSGRAVIALQQEADLGTSLYMDNLAGAIEHTGRVIIDLIPKFYDTERIVRLRGEDDAVNFVAINKPILTPDGLKIQHDLSRGKYDVRVGVGPSYRTRRLEAANSMVELARVFPQVLQVAGDLVAKNLDWPGADEMAERLKKLLPPGMIDEEQQVDPMAAQLQQMQLMQQMENQQLENAEKRANIANKQADTFKKMSEVDQNEVENALELAEFAKETRDQVLLNRALMEITKLMNEQPNVPQPGPTMASGI